MTDGYRYGVSWPGNLRVDQGMSEGKCPKDSGCGTAVESVER